MTSLRFRALVSALAPLVGAPALAVTPDITVSQQSGVAPLAVFFDARGTADSSRSPVDRFLDLAYQWDFGDAACEATRDVWQISGKSKCEDLGPVAGHVYETPGTYIAELTVDDGVAPQTTSITITVSDPDVVFSGTKTVCVSRNGDFSDPNGVCDSAEKVTSTANFTTLRNQYLPSGGRLLLRRGDAWPGGEWKYAGTQPTIVGAYGVGSKPRIDMGAEPMFTFGSNDGLRVMDLDVHGNDDVTTGSVVYASSQGQGKNALFLRVDATDLAKPFQLQVNGGPVPLSGYMNNGIAIVESTTRSRPHGSANNDFFGGGERFIFMGNDFGNADGTEHTLRFQYLKGAVVSHNRMGGNVPDDKAVIKMHNIFDGKPCTEEVVLADNRAYSGGASNVWGLSPANNQTPAECIRLQRIERNQIFFTKGTASAHRQIQLHGGDSLIANNLLDLTGSNTVVRPHGIIVQKRVSTQTTAPDNNRIYNNTCYMADSRPGMKCVVVYGANNKVYNNLAYAPKVAVTDVDAAENAGASSNVLSGNRIASSNPFQASSPGSAWGDFKLGPGGASMVDAGTKLPATLSSDFTGIVGTRTAGSSIDVGAFEDRGAAVNKPNAPVFLDN